MLFQLIKELSINLKNEISNISSSKFIRSVVTVASGAALAQLISIIFSPMITRIYGPEAFGILGVFTSILSILSPVAALTYPTAIVLPKHDSEAKGLVNLSFYISLFFSIGTFIFMYIFKEQLVALLQIQEISDYVFLIPVSMFFLSVFQIFQQWHIRKNNFKLKATVTTLSTLLLHIFKVVVGLLFTSASTLIIITVLGYGFQSILFLIGGGATVSSIIYILGFKKQEASSLLIKYKDFPIFRAPQVLFNGVSESLPTLMLASLFGPAAVGFYSLGKKLLQVPTQVIGNSIGDVFYPRISEAFNNGKKIYKILFKANLILSIIGILPFGFIIIFGPILFSLFFGSEWAVAGEYARWMSLWMYFVFITRPSVKVLPVIKAQKFHLNFTIITIIGRALTLYIGGYIFKNEIIAIALFSVFGSIMYLSLAIITIIKSKNIQNNRKL